MNVAGAILVVLLFGILLRVLRLVDRTQEVLSISRRSLAIVTDAQLDDSVKEKTLQQNAVRLFTLLFLLVAAGFVAVAGPLAVVWLLDLGKVLSFDAVLQILFRWDFMVVATILGVVAYRAGSGRRM